MPQFRDPNEKRDFMLNTPIPRLVPKMALPSIAGMLVTSAYNLADTLFVSQLGTDATGAVGVNGSIDLIIMMAGSLLAVGAASLTSRLLGAKQDERAREVLSTCFFLALALGTLVLILGFTYQDKILLLLGANEEILPYSEQYCRYILLAAPFMATSFVLNQCLRAEGSAVFSMIGMVAGAVLNVGLDPLFIFTFGWGVAGASAATAISKVVSWCILMTPYFRKKTLLTIRFRQFRPRWSDAKEVCAMGSASFFRNGLGTLAGILLNRIAVGYGTSALAAINVANRITMFMTSACLGFGQGFQPVAGIVPVFHDRMRRRHFRCGAHCRDLRPAHPAAFYGGRCRACAHRRVLSAHPVPCHAVPRLRHHCEHALLRHRAGAAVAAAGARAAGHLLLPDTASYGPALGRVGHRVGAGRGGHARDAARRADRRARLARHPAAGGRAGGKNFPGVSFFARMDVYA